MHPETSFFKVFDKVSTNPDFKDAIYCFEGNTYLEQDSLSSSTNLIADGSISKLTACRPEYNLKSGYFNT